MVEEVLDVTSGEWKREVLEVPGLVLVDFWAPWCDPCASILPVIEELARQYTGKLKVLRLNIDDSPDIARTYKVTIVPTVIFFRGAQKLHEIICAVPKTQLDTAIQALL